MVKRQARSTGIDDPEVIERILCITQTFFTEDPNEKQPTVTSEEIFKMSPYEYIRVEPFSSVLTFGLVIAAFLTSAATFLTLLVSN